MSNDKRRPTTKTRIVIVNVTGTATAVIAGTASPLVADFSLLCSISVAAA